MSAPVVQKSKQVNVTREYTFVCNDTFSCKYITSKNNKLKIYTQTSVKNIHKNDL